MREADQALQSLWVTLFGEPPSIAADADLLIRVLGAALPAAPPYRPAEPDGAKRAVYPEASGR